MAYILLTIAILAEVTATISLKLSDGFTRAIPAIVVVVGYLVAFGCLATLLKSGMPVTVAYAIWSSAGIALVAVVGAVFLREPLNLPAVVGLLLVIGGIVMLELGRAH